MVFPLVHVLGDVAVAVGADVLGGAVAVVGGAGAAVLVGPVVAGSVLVGAVVGALVVGALDVGSLDVGALVGDTVVVAVGVGLGAGFTPPLCTLKRPCRV
jgi:hypothetical protein